MNYNNMDNEFYPTPKNLIDKLCEGIDFYRTETVLEPSAGKGDITDEIQYKIKNAKSMRYNDKYKANIDVIEIDTNLQHILKGKGYRLIHDDFLTLNTYKKYDLIIMNPPFSNGDEHLLKAIEMQQRYGGDIRCILNAETIKNPYSNKRKELVQKLNDLKAEIQYIPNAFINAERKTGVEIAVIKINIPKTQPESDIYKDLEKTVETEKATQYNSTDLITNDFIKGIVQQYNFEVRLGIKLIEECAYMQSKILKSFNGSDSILALTLNDYIAYHYPENVKVNDYIKKVREKYWTALFENKEFTGLLTTKLKDQYRNNIDKLTDYDFSEFNIYSIKIDINNCMLQGVEKSILEFFDECSIKYYYHEECGKNIHYYNGWKTNKAYKVGEKIIIPINLAIGHKTDYSNDERKRIPVIEGNIEKLIDIEKVFNYLDGGKTEGIDVQESLKIAASEYKTAKIKCKYFDITFYKKGTCHITFTDLDVLRKFNIYGSQKKGWLPPTYGKKKYKDMNKEEQSIINEFGGADEYEKVLSQKDYYLSNSNQLLAITGEV